MLRSIKYGVYGAVLAAVVAAPAMIGGGTDAKSVQLVVDGHVTTVRTTAANVAGVLGAKGYHAGVHDLVAPDTRARVKDGMRIVLRRGRLLHLDINGRRRDIWTVAPTVQVALSQLGYTSTDFVSVSRSRRLPLDPTGITIRTPKLVTLTFDGQTEKVSTTDATVAQLLADMAVTLGPEDRVSVPVATALQTGQTVRVQRVTGRMLITTVPLKYRTVRHTDSSLTYGDTVVVTSGRNGTAQVTYGLAYVDGTIVSRTLLSRALIRAPRTEVVSVGTDRASSQTSSGSRGPSSGAVSPGAAQAIAKQLLAGRGWSDQFSCLQQMWNRESGWNVYAANPSGAYGIPQALPGSKMASAGPNWQGNAQTQIAWGLDYIASRYGDPCGAWSFWQAHNWY